MIDQKFAPQMESKKETNNHLPTHFPNSSCESSRYLKSVPADCEQRLDFGIEADSGRRAGGSQQMFIRGDSALQE